MPNIPGYPPGTIVIPDPRGGPPIIIPPGGAPPVGVGGGGGTGGGGYPGAPPEEAQRRAAQEAARAMAARRKEQEAAAAAKKAAEEAAREAAEAAREAAERAAEENARRLAEAQRAGGPGAAYEAERQRRALQIIETRPDINVVSPTTGDDIYVVRIPQEDGTYKQLRMRGDEIRAAGGEIPQDVQRRAEAGRIGRAEGAHAVERKEREWAKEDAIKRVADEYGLTPAEVKRLGEIIKSSPGDIANIPEFKNIEALYNIAYVTGTPLNKVDKMVQSLYEPVGTDLKQGKPQYMLKSEYEEIRAESPQLAELLKRKGYGAYSVTIRNITERAGASQQSRAFMERYIKADVIPLASGEVMPSGAIPALTKDGKPG